MTGKRATITDVATFAGVSKATVSAVLNDGAGVSDATRQRVLGAIERLNYRPTRAAAGRAGARRGGSIALLVKEHDNPYYAAIVDGVLACAEAQGYTVLVVGTAGDVGTERRAVELLRDKDVDGLIVTPVFHQHADLSHFFELKRRNVPFVLLEEIRGVPASLVDIDNVAASRAAVEHLLALGHERIVHLAGPPYSMHSQERIDGVRHAFSVAHVAFAAEGIVPTGAHLADGLRVGRALFAGRPADERPTAVTCYNDLVAVGLLRALHELGLRVPDDVSVVGFDDIPLCEFLPVPLTSVRVPKREMGELAAQLLVRQIEARESLAPQKVILEPTLVARASTAAPAVRLPPRAGLAAAPHETSARTARGASGVPGAPGAPTAAFGTELGPPAARLDDRASPGPRTRAVRSHPP